MADLSAYIDFTLTLDKSGTTPVFTLVDTGTYPSYVKPYVTGFIKIVQPDLIITSPDFSDPDVEWSGSALSDGTVQCRLATDGTPQNGLYTVTYTVKCPGYSDTILVRSLTLDYEQPEICIEPLCDVFTPSIKVYDATVFTQAGFTLTSSTRSWRVLIDLVGTVRNVVTSALQTVDLAVSSYYYDALYTATLSYTFTYQVTTSTWFYITEALSEQEQFDAYTPLSLSQLLTYLNILKEAAADLGTGVSEITKSQYIKAVAIYEHLIARGEAGDTVGLGTYEQQLEAIFLPYRSVPIPHSNAPIPAYVWSSGSSDNEVTLVYPSNSSWLATAGTLVEKFVVIQPTGSITLSIGTTVGGTDILEPSGVTNIGVFAQDKYFNAGATIYFTGVDTLTIIKIYKR